MKRSLCRLVVAASALAAVGCAGPDHLSEGFGASTRGAMARQAVRPPDKAPAAPVAGLDSQESSIVSEGYRRSLAPKGAAVEEQPVVLAQPAPAPPARTLPPPSVPSQGK